MMGRGAFILLKASRLWPKNAEQAKIQLAILLRILPIDDSEGRSPRHGREIPDGCINCDFRGIWLICPELFALLSGSQF
jgi:hypothetical protein